MYFLDIDDILHKEFVPPGWTVNGNFCCDVLRWQKENVLWKCLARWCNGTAPAHMSLLVWQILTSMKMTAIPSPAPFPHVFSNLEK